MYIVHSIILGIVEGITEFLPISSTAHLVVAEKALGFKDESEIYTVVIQLGAIVAASWFFRKSILEQFALIIKKDPRGFDFLKALLIGLVPAGVIGFIVEQTIGIPSSITLIGWALLLGGIILLMVEKKVDKLPLDKESNIDYTTITPKKALAIGIGQCFAIIPGVSRSGATIATGLMSGINRPTATAFSFFLSIPIMIAASLLKLVTDYDQLPTVSGGVSSLLVGIAVSFVTAFFVVGWLLRYVQRHDFKPFAYYRILAGIVILFFL